MPTFTGGSQHDDSDWTDGANWDSGEPPHDGDDLTIGDNPDWASPIYPGGNLSVKSLAVGRQMLIMNGGTITCTDHFTLTGTISGGGTIAVAGSGTIVCGTADPKPGLGNDATLAVTGTLTIQGPGTFEIGGGQCRIANSGTVIFVNSTLFWSAGTNPIVENTGVISVAGTAVCAGGDIRNHGSVSISSGSTLVISSNGLLHQMSDGRIAGPGTLKVGEPLGFGARLSIEGNTVLPSDLTLELTDNGLVTTPTAAANPPTLMIQGKLVIEDGSLNAWTTLAAGASCTFTGTDGDLYGGKFTNLATITVAANKTMNLTSGIDLINSGRLVLSGGSNITYAGGTVRFRNQGLIASAGARPNILHEINIENTGNLMVKEGALSLEDGSAITMTSGVLDLAATKITSTDHSGSISLFNGTVGGVVRGHGTIEVNLVNGGLVEPNGTGLALMADYAQDVAGGLVIVEPKDNAHPPLVITGTAVLNGSLFVRAHS